jgi:hypothetical protein
MIASEFEKWTIRGIFSLAPDSLVRTSPTRPARSSLGQERWNRVSCRLCQWDNKRAGLLAAIHRSNPVQTMAIMTADPKEVREKLPEALRNLPVLRKPFSIEEVLRLLRQPALPT